MSARCFFGVFLFVFLTIGIIWAESDPLPSDWEEDIPQPRCGLCRCEENNFIQCNEKDTLEDISHIRVPVDYNRNSFLFL